MQVMWALCVYLEAVSVVPQLRMMQGAKVVEKFTAHYVFALGLSRFVSCAHWILQILDGDSFLLQVPYRHRFYMKVCVDRQGLSSTLSHTSCTSGVKYQHYHHYICMEIERQQMRLCRWLRETPVSDTYHPRLD